MKHLTFFRRRATYEVLCSRRLFILRNPSSSFQLSLFHNDKKPFSKQKSLDPTASISPCIVDRDNLDIKSALQSLEKLQTDSNVRRDLNKPLTAVINQLISSTAADKSLQPNHLIIQFFQKLSLLNYNWTAASPAAKRDLIKILHRLSFPTSDIKGSIPDLIRYFLPISRFKFPSSQLPADFLSSLVEVSNLPVEKIETSDLEKLTDTIDNFIQQKDEKFLFSTSLEHAYLLLLVELCRRRMAETIRPEHDLSTTFIRMTSSFSSPAGLPPPAAFPPLEDVLERVGKEWQLLSNERRILVLKGLSRWNIQFIDLNESFRANIAMFPPLDSQLSSSTIIESFTALKGIGCHWSDFPASTQEDLQQSLIALRRRLSTSQMVALLEVLEALKVNFSRDFEERTQKSLEKSLQRISHPPAKELGSILRSCRAIGMTRDYLSVDFCDQLFTWIFRNLKHCRSGLFASYLLDLGSLRFRYRNMPSEVQDSILSHSQVVFETVSKVKTMNSLLLGFHSLEVPIAKLPVEDLLRRIYTDLFRSRSDSLLASEVKDFSITLNALGKLGVRWSKLSFASRGILLHVFRLTCRASFDASTAWLFSQILEGMGSLGVKSFALDSETKSILETSLQSYCQRWTAVLKAKHVATLFYGLAQLQVGWEKLSPPTQRALLQLLERHCPAFDARELSNVLYATSILCFEAVDALKTEEDLKDVLTFQVFLLKRYHQLAATNSVNSSVDPRGRHQVAIYFEWLRALRLRSPEFHRRLLSAAPLVGADYSLSSQSLPSELHLDFVERIRELWSLSADSLHLSHEFRGLQSGVFPVDCAVEYNHQLIAFLEFGGFGARHETGYSYQSGKIVIDRVDALKEFLYRTNHPSVPYLRVNILRRSDPQQEAEFLVRTLEELARGKPLFKDLQDCDKSEG